MALDGGLRIELFVDDIERSVTFYEQVLGFTREREDPGYVVVTRGAATIGIGAAADLPKRHYFDPTALRARRGIGVEIVVEVDDIDAAYGVARASFVQILTPLGQRSWGASDFRIADPDGYYLRITSR